MNAIPIFLLIAISLCRSAWSESEPRDVVRITVLSTNLADTRGIGEWGWSALLQIDNSCVLYDTGNHPRTVLDNAKALNIDLSCVNDVVLSHHHSDHTGGLMTLRSEYVAQNANAFSRIHVATGMFYPRTQPDGTETNAMIAVRDALEKEGVTFFEYTEPTEILPSVWITGPVKRIYPEQDYPLGFDMRKNTRWNQDYIPESQGLAVNTQMGFVVILGCGHAGVVNTLTYVQSSLGQHPIHAVLGGFHLHSASQSTIDWIGRKFHEIGVQHVMGSHCTALEPLYRIREQAGLSRKTAIVGAVGATFEYGTGFVAGVLAR